ncbi:MAG: polysaccharide biosynthesis protein [Clostridiales bacterium]|uniref:nucleoside-diphosphate sugar epimerase/dehydratase n=1 Tax=Clostridium sp. N3C TaxID=1776758 RepID=UPI00092E047B|nr:nucleoside-diphosphate sugar epimerase/dehydratase [Clostridium sp. N3C]NLZ49309.1 polysaccharide biosynthesis protein [Clostridiales bacterium]SCN23792.1 UDP-N-acetyl-alpha-D-glucosamine C6 dehydratase [Clostridium sp. N3C]
MRKINKLIIIDIVFVILSLYLAFLLRFDFGMDNAYKEYLNFAMMSIVPFVIITIACNYLFSLYSRIWRYASVEELLSIVLSVSLSNVLFIVYSYVINYKVLHTSYFRFPFSMHIIAWIISVALLGGVRFIFRIGDAANQFKEGTTGKKKLLIIGAGEAAAMLIREIKNHRELNYNIIGLIDDDVSKLGRKIKGVKVLGDRSDIEKVCKEYKVDEIIVAIPSADNKTKREIYNKCKNTKCKLKTLPGIYELIDNKKIEISKIRDVNIEDLLGREEVHLNIEGISKYVKDKVVLVTGGGGSIGSELCRQVAKFDPSKLLVLDIYENGAYDLQMQLKYDYPDLDLEVVIASIRDYERLKQLFEQYKPDVVFHAAAHKHVPLMEDNPSEAIKNNILGTYNLLNCARDYKVKKFVQISTDKAVNPTNIMGATKRFCEIMVQAFDKVSETEFVAVRFGNVLGSNGSVIPLFKEQIAKGGPVTVTHPEINRFFMTIPEAAQLVLQAGAMADGGEIFVLDMGKPVKIVDLARDLIRLSGLKPDEDIKIKYTGLRKGEKLYEELLMSEVALTSTNHEKIFVEKPMEYDMEFVKQSVEEFQNIIYSDKEEIFKLIQKKVPTYKRNLN